MDIRFILLNALVLCITISSSRSAAGNIKRYFSVKFSILVCMSGEKKDSKDCKSGFEHPLIYRFLFKVAFPRISVLPLKDSIMLKLEKMFYHTLTLSDFRKSSLSLKYLSFQINRRK